MIFFRSAHWRLGSSQDTCRGFDTRPSVSNDRGALYVLPRLGTVVSGELGGGPFLGRLQLLAEPLYARYFRPFGATAAGGSLIFKYNLVTFGRWVPYLDAGAGMLWSDLPPALDYGPPFNFVLQVGPGLQYFVSSNYASPSACGFITSLTRGLEIETSASTGSSPILASYCFAHIDFSSSRAMLKRKKHPGA